VTGPRLGEIATEANGCFSRTRLGESSLAWASPLLAQKWGPSPRLQLQRPILKLPRKLA